MAYIVTITDDNEDDPSFVRVVHDLDHAQEIFEQLKYTALDLGQKLELFAAQIIDSAENDGSEFDDPEEDDDDEEEDDTTEIITSPRKTNTTVKLIGESTNAFMILGRVMEAMRRDKVSQEVIDQYQKEATSDDYSHLLFVTSQYVKIV